MGTHRKEADQMAGQATREHELKVRQAQAQLCETVESQTNEKARTWKPGENKDDGPLCDGQWVATGWWRVVTPEGQIWCETSDQDEAQERMRPGDIMYQLYEKKSTQWKYMIHKEIEERDHSG